MGRERLRFRISGREIAYEGHPENRHKDLMEILAKMGVAEDKVVGIFRENIEDESNYTDEQILEHFTAARRAREAKQQARAAAAAAAANNNNGGSGDQQHHHSNSNSHQDPGAPEVPRRITLTFQGRQFSYEGLPSGKQNAVVQLLCKQRGVTEAVAVETFRANLPDVQATDEEIWTMVTEAQAARAARKGGSSSANANASTHDSGSNNNNNNSNSGSSAAAAAAAPHSTRTAAVEELAGMTMKEREDIDNFIRNVIENPIDDVPIASRPLMQPGSSRAQQQQDDDNPELMNTARAMNVAGKIAVYCQEKGTNGTKVIYATPQITFAEFSALVEKKFGRKMALSFYEDEDVIELDDDDVLTMFLEMSTQGDAKKLKLICSDPASRAVVRDDAITEGATGAAGGGAGGAAAAAASAAAHARTQPFSNGELTVKEERTFTGHSLPVYCCAFSPSGEQFVSASRDRSVRLWDVKSGSNTVMRGGHNGFVLSCDFSPKGNRVVSSSDDEMIKVWNTSSCSKVSTLRGHTNKVYCVKYNSTGDYIVSGSCDRTVRVWNAESCSKIVTLKGHTLPIFSCCFSNDKKSRYVASGSDDRLIKIWDWEANKEVKSLVGHIGTVWSVAFSHNDALLVSASMDHELKVWDNKTGACLRTMTGHNASIHNACFSDDDAYIFSCARDWSVMVWRTEDGERVQTITGHSSSVYHIDVQGDKLLSCSLDDSIKLWSVTRNETAVKK